MEKIITIDGKDIPFKSTGLTVLRYKAAFHKDFLAEMLNMMILEELLAGKIAEADPEKIDLDVVYRIAWVMAKTADEKIPPMMEWLDNFDEFPVFDVLEEISELLESLVRSAKKK